MLCKLQVSLPNLTHLELGEKFFPVEDDKMEEMRKIIFQKLPTLRYLEGTDIDNKDEDDDRENEDDEDEEDEDDEDEDEDDHGFENGIAGIVSINSISGRAAICHIHVDNIHL